MEYYSNNEKADTINRVRGGISEVKNVMIENIDKVRCCGTLKLCAGDGWGVPPSSLLTTSSAVQHLASLQHHVRCLGDAAVC